MHHIAVLMENSARGIGLRAEHGLAFWIQWQGHRYLFDAGQSDLLGHNADRLEVHLSTAEALVLSHGHYDHTGGMACVLRHGEQLPVFLHRDALSDKYDVKSAHNARYIGISPDNRMLLRDKVQCPKII